MTEVNTRTCMYGDKVYTWDYRNKQIVKSVREKMDWKRQERVVNVKAGVLGSVEDIIVVVRQYKGGNIEVEFFVCLCDQNTILRVPEEGEQISQYEDRSAQGRGETTVSICVWSG